MQLTTQLPTDRAHESDITHRLVQAIALELWRLYGRNGSLNWPGVERHLSHIVNQARNDVRDSLSALISVAAAAHPPTPRVVRPARPKRALPRATPAPRIVR